MKARIKWLDHMSFVGESGSGHSVVMDSSPDDGGRNLGVRPMEMVLLGLGGCTAIDVMLILQKARQQVEDCIVEISAERASEPPKVFTKIHLHYRIKGRELSSKQVERAISLSSEKYCSVTKMLEKTAQMTHDFELLESPGG
ncbi:MAG TPA: OsmC family protein [Gammaproteobacteria bacterium]|nr:OsmC family protein [Gammaproteobacteria bacterium]